MSTKQIDIVCNENSAKSLSTQNVIEWELKRLHNSHTYCASH